MPDRLMELFEELGIPQDYQDSCGQPRQEEATELVSCGKDVFDREQQMTPATRDAWNDMCSAAAKDGVELQLVSAYRGIDYQGDLIRRKLDRGDDIHNILKVNAAPGFSEHHTGRALDLTTPGTEPLEESFEETDAFQWLCQHAGEYGFRMSYPRENPYGIAYEPWHWAYFA